MGGQTSGQALKGPGGSAARPLLPGTGPVVAVAIVVVCVLVTAVQAVWLRHGMETGWLDTAIDARVQASLAGHPRLLAVLVWPGEPVPAARDGRGPGAGVCLAAALSRGRVGGPLRAPCRRPDRTCAQAPHRLDSLGRPLPQRTRHHRGRLGHCPDRPARQHTRQDATPPASRRCFPGLPDGRRGRRGGDRREYASLHRHCRRSRRRHWDCACDRARPRPAQQGAFPTPR